MPALARSETFSTPMTGFCMAMIVAAHTDVAQPRSVASAADPGGGKDVKSACRSTAAGGSDDPGKKDQQDCSEAKCPEAEAAFRRQSADRQGKRRCAGAGLYRRDAGLEAGHRPAPGCTDRESSSRCLQGRQMELALLWRGGRPLVPELPLLHALREGDVLPRHFAVAAAARRLETSGGALLRHPRGRARRKAVQGLGAAGRVASGREDVTDLRTQVPQNVASTRSWSSGGCIQDSNPG